MLADTIEAAVRSMKDPTPKAIDQFIERLIRGKLEDGQLSDCPLSLRDIDLICEAFSGILKGVYHERIEYPKVQQFAIQKASSEGPEQSSATAVSSGGRPAEAVPESEERESPSEPSSNTVAEDPLPQVDSEAERKQDAGNDKPEES